MLYDSATDPLVGDLGGGASKEKFKRRLLFAGALLTVSASAAGFYSLCNNDQKNVNGGLLASGVLNIFGISCLVYRALSQDPRKEHGAPGTEAGDNCCDSAKTCLSLMSFAIDLAVAASAGVFLSGPGQDFFVQRNWAVATIVAKQACCFMYALVISYRDWFCDNQSVGQDAQNHQERQFSA